MTSPPSRSPLRWLAALFVPLLLAACATPFNANVKRFSSQMPPPAGQTFAVVAEDPRDAGGIEFGQYAELVAAQMARLGYVRSDPARAAMIVRFHYEIDKGRDRVRRTGISDPYWGFLVRATLRRVLWSLRRTLPAARRLGLRLARPVLLRQRH
jgi:hypothetical protein